MKNIPTLITNMLNKSIQPQKITERELWNYLLRYAKVRGAPIKVVRKCMLLLNLIEVSEIKNGHNLHESTIYNTITGARPNDEAKVLISNALHMEVKELFPEERP